jgi:3-hydroxyacyl-[acyl-carrier-protein] dehydratase
MLLLDRLTDIVPFESAVGIKNVTANEWFFQGHFPDNPIMPGVLIIEALAQAAGTLVSLSLGKSSEKTEVFFMSIDHARFRRPVVPGDTLHLHVKKDQSRGNVWKFSGTAKVNDAIVAEAIFTAMISDI